MTKSEVVKEIRFWGLFVGHKILSIDIDDYIIITSVSESGTVYYNVLKEENGNLEHIETTVLN